MRQLSITGCFLLSLIFVLPIQAKQDATEPVPDLFSEQIGEYISNIKPWEKDKLWITMYRLYRYVQKNHPETIEYLENNADNNANFSYILALLEHENNFDNDRSVISDYSDSGCVKYKDKTTHLLHAAAQQEHAAALYYLSDIYFCKGDISQSFDYYRRAFYAGYYDVLGSKEKMDIFREIYPQHIADMERYAKRTISDDFLQIYRLMTFFYYERGDKEVAQHFYKLAEEKVPDYYRYMLVSFNNKLLDNKFVCNEKEINTYRRSILAGNIRALRDFVYRCKTESVTQKIVTEGLHHIEQRINTRILAWQEGHMNYRELFDHINAVRDLSGFYYYKMGDLQKTDDYYQHLTQLGNASVFNELGNMWLHNLFLSMNKSDNYITFSFKESCQKARDYFVQGSQHNQSYSIVKLAIFYLNEQCVIKDEAQSIQYQEKLSVLADSSVYATSDLLYLSNKLNEMGYFSQAKKYAQQLADYGDINAMQLLAQLWLIDQDGLEIDEQKAQFWYEKTFAIMQNDPPILGYQYIEASKNFRKAGFNETADTYLQRAIELLGDEAVQKILQEEPVE